MAHLARSVFRRGAALGGFPFSAAPTNAGVACRAMSTSWMAKSAGSVLGRHSVKVRNIPRYLQGLVAGDWFAMTGEDGALKIGKYFWVHFPAKRAHNYVV